MPPKRTGYSSYFGRPKKKTTKRITMPGVPSRPLRFQLRSILRHDIITPPSPWWMVVHRRGIKQERVGQDPNEARAVPHGVIKGYLDERILYATLVNLFHFIPGVDFDYQSSIDGGRLEMGGLVCDFIFRYLRIVINPLGPQHYQFRNVKKDEEQVSALAEMGYQCYLVDVSVIMDEYKLEDFLRRIFGGMTSGGGDSGGGDSQTSSGSEQEADQYLDLYNQVVDLQDEIEVSFA